MRLKFLLRCLAFLFMAGTMQAQPFITRWNMGVAGSAIGQLNVGVVTSGPCTYTWVTAPAGQSGSGTFSGDTMTISGLPTSGWIDLSIDTTNFRQLRVANGPDQKRLIAVHQWGKMKWANCDSVFSGCSNMASLGVDTPDFLWSPAWKACLQDRLHGAITPQCMGLDLCLIGIPLQLPT